MITAFDVAAIAVPLALLALVSLLFTWRALLKLKHRYKGVIDVDRERDQVAAERNALTTEIRSRRTAWETDYAAAIRELEELSRELDTARDRAELQSFGIYEPHYDFETSAGFKGKLDEIRTRQKSMVRDKTAAVCRTDWVVGSSKTEGRRMTDRYLKLQLRAFNGECDAAVIKVRFNNVVAMEKRITRAFETLNKLGETLACAIVPEYPRSQEQRVAFGARVRRETASRKGGNSAKSVSRCGKRSASAARSRKPRPTQRKRSVGYEAALERARRELQEAGDQERAELEEEIAKLQGRLDEAHTAKERAMSRAQLTRSGHVYVVSNIGSFGRTSTRSA